MPQTQAEKKYWTESRQRRFDEAYLDALIPENDRFKAGRETAPLDEVRWNTQRHIFGYGELPADFVATDDN